MSGERMITVVSGVAVGAATLTSAHAAIYEVGAGKPYTTIQAAIDQAQSDLVGNVYSVPATITVHSGTYVEKVNIPADPTNNQFVFTKYDQWNLQAASGANVLLQGHLFFGGNREGFTVDGINIDNSNPGGADPDLYAAINFAGGTARDNTIKNAVIYGINPDQACVRGDLQYGMNTLDHVTVYNTDYGVTGNSNSYYVVKNSIIAFGANRGFFSTQPSSIQFSDVYGNNPNFGGGQSDDGGNLSFGTGLDPMFVTTNPASPYFLQLNPSSPAAGTAQGGTNMGARPVFDPRWGVNAPGNWTTPGSWLFNIVPNSTNAKATFGDAITAPRTVTVDAPVTAGRLTFDDADSYTIAGPNPVTLQVSTGGASIDVTAGSHAIAAPLSLVSSTTVTVTPAGSTLDVTGPMSAGGGVVLTKAGAGTLKIRNVRTSGLTVSAGTLRIAADGTAAGTSKVGALSVTGGAKLDLADNKLVTSSAVGTWSGSAYTGVAGLVDSGRGNVANAQWNGSGIVTTDTRAVNNNDLASIGVVDASDKFGGAETATHLFAGQTITGADTLVMFTWGGDANVDGKINIDDYGQIDFNVGSSGSVFGWYNGDFNYDGKINIDDYGIIDFNVSAQGAAFPTAGAIDAGIAAVPEPAGAALLVACAAATSCARRRRRHR